MLESKLMFEVGKGEWLVTSLFVDIGAVKGIFSHFHIYFVYTGKIHQKETSRWSYD